MDRPRRVTFCEAMKSIFGNNTNNNEANQDGDYRDNDMVSVISDASELNESQVESDMDNSEGDMDIDVDSSESDQNDDDSDNNDDVDHDINDLHANRAGISYSNEPIPPALRRCNILTERARTKIKPTSE